VLVSRLSRQILMRWRGRMMLVGQGGRIMLGATSLAVAVLILGPIDIQVFRHG
jgi:hypothetical protein